MGSLNGDIMVIRNGRSTSQISVYNYPEHLNPFYEDDQHKRLRFWKINKKDNEGRRNSFSITNLKDMWAFKSFRTKKKSSTLGINKTSESPPVLRRNHVLDNGWNTFDNRLRASNTPSINGDSFQRNATYRSSLQTLPSSSDRIGLNRNDGYRSTIQVTRSNPRYQLQQNQQQTMGVSQNRRYVYGGSVTPQPFRNARTNICKGPYEYDCDNDMIRRSSQSSMVSTNPFESDDDDNDGNNTSGTRSIINGSTGTLTTRTPRKKRRAPAPPTPPIHGCSNGLASVPIIRIEPSQDSIQDELHIDEDIEIANLTAEIESFVKTKNNDDAELKQNDKVQTSTESSITKSLDRKEKTIKLEDDSKTPVKTPAPIDTSHTAIIAHGINKGPSPKEKANRNGKVTTEIVTIRTTTTKTTAADVTEDEPVEKEINVGLVSREIETKINESKEIKTNRATPKKQHNNNPVASSSVVQQHVQQQSTPAAAELCIKETNADQLPQKPVPLKRQTKPEDEVGHVECIHVHVESPKATPRNDYQNGLSSFKTTETSEDTEDTITVKTPFTLTSPPLERKNHPPTENTGLVIKETVKIVDTSTVKKPVQDQFNIKEEQRINAKPKIPVKPPTLSPKPITKESNAKIHGFAEIHKPMRRTNQNGQVRRTSRDGSVSPPTIPQLETKENEKKFNKIVGSHPDGTNEEKKLENCKRTTQFEFEKRINKTVDCHTDSINEEKKLENCKRTPQFEPSDKLKIIETRPSINRSEAEEKVKKEEVKENNCETSVITAPDPGNHNGALQKQDNEFDLIYRPKPASYMEWKQSTLAPLETHIPPEKRKSVKDIIESINRSQRLLNAAANKDFTLLQNQNETVKTQPSPVINNNNLNENLRILDETEKEISRLVEETTVASYTDAENLSGSANSPSPSPSNYNNEYIEAQQLDNNEIFKKCKVKKEVYDYREKSPISSNLDWNPVPKPKRTKPGYE